MKNKISIRICGKEYAIVGYESDEYMQKVSLYIDKKMKEVIKNNSKLSTAQAAVLTSINIADDYYKTLEAYTTVENEFSRSNIEFERIKKEYWQRTRFDEECVEQNGQTPAWVVREARDAYVADSGAESAL